MIEYFVLLLQVLFAGFLATGCALSLLQLARRNLPVKAAMDRELFSYGAANDFETDYRRLFFTRATRIARLPRIDRRHHRQTFQKAGFSLKY
jgi:hypothetical protein